MARGKQTCKILKEIRQQIAAANDIAFVTDECRYKGDCLGTCPKCEEEVRYLEQQLRKRQLAGKVIKLAGISASALAMLSPLALDAQTSPEKYIKLGGIRTQTRPNTFSVCGVVFNTDSLQDGVVTKEPLRGVRISNLYTSIATSSDCDGIFSIRACKGDTLKIDYFGSESKKFIKVVDDNPIEVSLNVPKSELRREDILSCINGPVEDKNLLFLQIIDEKNNPFSHDEMSIERVYYDEDGEEKTDYLKQVWPDDEGMFRIYWNWNPDLLHDDGKPLKEVIFRIEVDGYEKPKTIKVKYPKRNTTKTIKFTSKDKK